MYIYLSALRYFSNAVHTPQFVLHVNNVITICKQINVYTYICICTICICRMYAHHNHLTYLPYCTYTYSYVCIHAQLLTSDLSSLTSHPDVHPTLRASASSPIWAHRQ